METNNNNEKKEKSWIERNAWWIALFIALFLFRMCNELSKH